MYPENNQTHIFHLGLCTYVVIKLKKKKGIINIKVWIVVTFVGEGRRYNELGAQKGLLRSS